MLIRLNVIKIMAQKSNQIQVQSQQQQPPMRTAPRTRAGTVDTLFIFLISCWRLVVSLTAIVP